MKTERQRRSERGGVPIGLEQLGVMLLVFTLTITGLLCVSYVQATPGTGFAAILDGWISALIQAVSR